MRDIEKQSRDWPRQGEWRVAPAGVEWARRGTRVSVGEGAVIDRMVWFDGSEQRIGAGVRLAAHVSLAGGVTIEDGAQLGVRANIGPAAFIGRDARLGDGVRLDEGVNLGAKAHLAREAVIEERCWINDGVRIGTKARIGARSFVLARASIAADTVIGGDAYIGAGSRDAIDIGWADGQRLCIAQVGGVAHISLMNEMLPLKEALRRWEERKEEANTLCLLQSAVAIARHKGWKPGASRH